MPQNPAYELPVRGSALDSYGKRFDLTRDQKVHIFSDAPAAFLLMRMLQLKLAGRLEKLQLKMP